MDEHAALTAKALSAMDPEYTGLLTLEIFKETLLYDWKKEGKFKVLSADEVLLETRMLLSEVDCPGSIFRMNHASNYLTLAGTLNKDRQALIEKIDNALSGRYKLREEWQRRLYGQVDFYSGMKIPGCFEPPVRKSGATLPEKGSHRSGE